MRIDFATFLNLKGKVIKVNPHLVRCLTEIEKGTRIWFDQEDHVDVTADIESAERNLTIDPD